MPNLFPYTNTHELNLDWILQVVKDFQTKYTNFDQALADALAAIEAGKTEALDEISTDLTAALNDIEATQTAALTAIGNTKDSALADIGTALTNATNAISALNTTVQGEITTLKNTSLSEITTAQGTAISAITASMNHATTIIEQLYNTLPSSAQDILGKLALLDNIITGNTIESFTWLQGSYVYPEGVTPPTPPAINTEEANYNYLVSNRYMMGVGGRRLRVITDGTIVMQYLLNWRNTPPGGAPGAYVPGQADYFTSTYLDLLIPLDVTAISLTLAKPGLTDTLSPTDIEGHIEIQWITDFVSQRIIAPKESSTTADVARQTGEYFFLDGDLYIATDDIAVGDTIAEETNCEKKTVGGEVSELKSAFDAFAYGINKVGRLTQAYQYLACNAPNGTVIIAQSVDSSNISYGLLLYNSSKQQIGSVLKSSGTGGVAYYNITIDNVAYLRAPTDVIPSDIYIQQGFNAEGKIVQAFNEIGDLSSLTTTTKSSVVSAVNEVKQNSVTQTDLSNNLNKMISQELCAIIMGHNDDLRTTLNAQHNYIDFSYNGTNWVMTIPPGTKLIGKNQIVSISSTTTVTFEKQDDWIIAYNLVNNTVDAIRLSSYTTYIATYPDKYLLIATLVSKSPRWISPSINAEYTINGIPAGFESIYHGIENIKYQMNIDFGDLNGITGDYSAVNVRRMVTVDILQYGYDVLVPAATNGIVAYLFTYSDSSGTLDEKIGAINNGSDYVISAGTYFRLLFYKDGDTGSYFGDKRNNYVFNNIFIYRRDDAERFVRISQRQNLGLYNENFRSVAHRGMSRIAPENTIPAYIEARRAGFIYVETDVAWTHDNVAVLLHDTTIDRTSNGTGNIADLDYDDIKDLDFGSWFSPKYAGTKIPTFEEFIQLCRKIGLHPVLDLRSHTQTQLDALVAMIIRNGMADHVEFVGGSPSGDYARIKESLPKAGYGYTVASSVTEEQIDAMLALKNGQNRVYITASTINSTMIEMCADAGIELEFWPAGTAASILALDPYVTGATTEGLIGGWILYASVIPN